MSTTGPATPQDADDPAEGQTMGSADQAGTLDASEDDPTARLDPHINPTGGAPDANPLGQA